MANLALAAGLRLGPYEILSPIGAGGMGEVYRAHDTRLRRDVAVKVLPAFSGGSPRAIARFHREARAVAALSHPHILAIHDVGEQEGVVYAVMELLEGETLRSRLDVAAIPARKAVEYASQIARGLAAAHDRGIIHRDLKPENLFLTRDGLVKILDFGLARQVDPEPGGNDDRTPASESGVILGTAGYMSPEQARGQAADERSDIFSLGAILFEMLMGQRAFAGSSPAEKLVAVLRDDPVPRMSGRSIPDKLSAIVSRCLQKTARDRFQSARDLAFALQSAETGSEGGELPDLAPQKPAEASIAVLPFRNLSADREADYFSDGITEEIITALSGIGALRVAARTSSFAFKGRDTDIRQIGRELGVRAVLEGSVRQAETRLRITAQLVDVESGYQLWSERYDRQMSDVFEVQDEIARAIADQLEPRLVGERRGPVVAAPTHNVQAYDLYLQGRYIHNRRQEPRAIQKFEAAIALDPGFGAAHLGIADSYAAWGFYGGIPTRTAYVRARAAAEKARALAPEAPGLHLSLGILEHYYGWDVALEERELRTAIAAGPRAVDAYFWLALCLSVQDRFEEAVEAGRRAIAAEPHSGNTQAALAWAWAGARRFDEAVPEFEKAVVLSPESVFPLWSLGHAQLEAGRADAAVDTLEKVVRLTQREGFFLMALLGRALAVSGRVSEARELLAELRRRERSAYVPPFDLAYLLVSLGETEEALAALERAFEERNAVLWYRIHMPAFDPLREKPRYRSIADRLAATAPVKRGGGWSAAFP